MLIWPLLLFSLDCASDRWGFPCQLNLNKLVASCCSCATLGRGWWGGGVGSSQRLNHPGRWQPPLSPLQQPPTLPVRTGVDPMEIVCMLYEVNFMQISASLKLKLWSVSLDKMISLELNRISALSRMAVSEGTNLVTESDLPPSDSLARHRTGK